MSPPLLVALLLFVPSVFAQDSRPSAGARHLQDARLARGVASFGAASADGWIWVYGGHTGKAHTHTRENLTGAFCRVRLEPAFAREELTAGPALQGLALVACEGLLCRIGGMQARNAPGSP